MAKPGRHFLRKEEADAQLQAFTEFCDVLHQDQLQPWQSVTVHHQDDRCMLRIRVRRTEHSFISHASNADADAAAGDEDEREIVEEPDTNVISLRADDEAAYTVIYDITYSVSYRVPVLYFALLDTSGSPQLDFEYMRTHLMAANARGAIDHAGGAITLENHPFTGQPTFHVHPCQTDDAMWDLNIGEERFGYLLAWIGLIGSTVGLHVPRALAQAIQSSQAN